MKIPSQSRVNKTTEDVHTNVLVVGSGKSFFKILLPTTRRTLFPLAIQRPTILWLWPNNTYFEQVATPFFAYFCIRSLAHSLAGFWAQKMLRSKVKKCVYIVIVNFEKKKVWGIIKEFTDERIFQEFGTW